MIFHLSNHFYSMSKWGIYAIGALIVTVIDAIKIIIMTLSGMGK